MAHEIIDPIGPAIMWHNTPRTDYTKNMFTKPFFTAETIINNKRKKVTRSKQPFVLAEKLLDHTERVNREQNPSAYPGAVSENQIAALARVEVEEWFNGYPLLPEKSYHSETHGFNWSGK